MAWDSARPVPWSRLFKDWLLYAGVMAVILAIVMRNDLTIGTFLGLLASLPMYLLFGGLLAKFGYVRKTLKDLRSQASEVRRPTSSVATPAGRPKPPPTRRTGGGTRPTRRR